MKKISLIMLLLLGFTGSLCAQKYITKTGKLSFEASEPSFEEVAATNATSTAVLDASNGNMAVLAFMNGFRFKVALMEEHFNENYIESEKFPKATFKGAVDGFAISKLSSDKKSYTVKGTLELHGKTKEVSTTAYISLKDGKIYMEGSFKVKPEDFDIEIPGVVSKKIADEVAVSFNFELAKR